MLHGRSSPESKQRVDRAHVTLSAVRTALLLYSFIFQPACTSQQYFPPDKHCCTHIFLSLPRCMARPPRRSPAGRCFIILLLVHLSCLAFEFIVAGTPPPPSPFSSRCLRFTRKRSGSSSSSLIPTHVEWRIHTRALSYHTCSALRVNFCAIKIPTRGRGRIREIDLTYYL